MEVRQLQVALYRQLAGAALLAVGAGWLLGRPTWGYAAALGCLATGLYFWMLGIQVLRMTALDRPPAPWRIVLSMLGRQAISVLACLLALGVWGTAWWACLIAILIGRHWVMVVASSRPAQ